MSFFFFFFCQSKVHRPSKKQNQMTPTTVIISLLVVLLLWSYIRVLVVYVLGMFFGVFPNQYMAEKLNFMQLKLIQLVLCLWWYCSHLYYVQACWRTAVNLKQFVKDSVIPLQQDAAAQVFSCLYLITPAFRSTVHSFRRLKATIGFVNYLFFVHYS